MLPEIEYATTWTCPACNGTGTDYVTLQDSSNAVCSRCKGRGYLVAHGVTEYPDIPTFRNPNVSFR